ncbi:MAG: Ig-like domain-containing protein [Ruminococcus sp.]|nr:Ig-like domain-containing protein [Ruminococcus sp.]
MASKVTLKKTSITLGIGETYDLNSSVPSGTAAYYRAYTSNSTSVATVNKSGGLITAKKIGTATITCKLSNGKKATCKVTVKKMATSVSLNSTSRTMLVGETFDLNSSIPSGTVAYYRIYTSSNTSVATVKKSGGLITAKGAGTATITCKLSNG